MESALSRSIAPEQDSGSNGANSTAKSCIETINSIRPSDFDSETDRAYAKDAAYALLTRLETPAEFLTRLIGYTPALLSSLGVCQELELFQKWNKADGGKPKSCVELSEMTGSNADLLRRIVRNVSVHGVLEQTACDRFQMGPSAIALADGPPMGFVTHGLDVRYPAAKNLPVWLKSISFNNPMDASDTNWEHLTGTKIYPWLVAQPDRVHNFDMTMKAYTRSLPEWVDIYPTSALVEDSKPDRPILVDIGGTRGQDLELLHRRHHDLAERSLVLQDRQDVISQTNLPSTIDTQVHDFFAEQPIKGARAYYFHHVLHDWSDREAAQILKPVAEAMERGYSKLLVHDIVVQEKRPRVMECSSDLQMMLLATGRDRTVADMKALLEPLGLKISKVWTTPEGPESILEAELVDRCL